MRLKNCSISEFINRVKDKEVICFGAGLMPNDICNLYENYHFYKYVKFILDNDINKWGKDYFLFNRNIKIISPSELKRIVSKDTVIIITSFFFMEILEQLNEFNELSETDVYIYPIMESIYPKLCNRKIEHFGEIKIPRVINYFWFGKGEIPSLERKCIESWYKYCPNYEIKLWNEDNYDINKIRYTKEAYDSKKWAFVTDYARLDILYNYGGVCLDADVELIKNIDDLLTDEAFSCFQDTGRVNLGLGVGAIKNNKVIKLFLDDYLDRGFINSDKTYNLTTCPIYQTNILLKYGLKQDNNEQVIENMRIYPSEVLSPKNSLTGIMNITGNTYSIHHYTWSWKNDKENASKLCINEKLDGLIKSFL